MQLEVSDFGDIEIPFWVEHFYSFFLNIGRSYFSHFRGFNVAEHFCIPELNAYWSYQERGECSMGYVAAPFLHQ